mgnify:CR=1 FL=1
MIAKALLSELKREAENTRKILKVVPADKFSWKPHKKSTNLLELTHHIAELTGWVNWIITFDELDFASQPAPEYPKNTDELVQFFDDNLSKSIHSLELTNDDDLLQKLWTLRMGEHILLQLPKVEVLRSICFNHIYHHRGQLSVYLRLLDVKIPGMYGPSADDEEEMRKEKNT